MGPVFATNLRNHSHQADGWMGGDGKALLKPRRVDLGRIKTLLDLHVGLPLEPIGFAPEEFRKMKEQGNRFILDILEEGRVIHGIVL